MSTTCRVPVEWAWRRNIQLILWQSCVKYCGSLVCPCSNLMAFEPAPATGYGPLIVHWLISGTRWVVEIPELGNKMILWVFLQGPIFGLQKSVLNLTNPWTRKLSKHQVLNCIRCKKWGNIIFRHKIFPNQSLLIKSWMWGAGLELVLEPWKSSDPSLSMPI